MVAAPVDVYSVCFQAVGRGCFGGPGDRQDAKNVALLISDGVPYPPHRYQPAVEEAVTLRTQFSEYTRSPLPTLQDLAQHMHNDTACGQKASFVPVHSCKITF